MVTNTVVGKKLSGNVCAGSLPVFCICFAKGTQACDCSQNNPQTLPTESKSKAAQSTRSEFSPMDICTGEATTSQSEERSQGGVINKEPHLDPVTQIHRPADLATRAVIPFLEHTGQLIYVISAQWNLLVTTEW